MYNDKGANPTKGYNTYKYYAPNIRAPKYIKQILRDLKAEIDNTVRLGTLIPPFIDG